MTFGPSAWQMPTTDEETSFKIMDRFAEYGGNFIDTADIYGPFHSEQIGTFFSITLFIYQSWEMVENKEER
jgi:aryl-alcohol dehydrogenase-like predicted oxidoreductase